MSRIYKCDRCDAEFTPVNDESKTVFLGRLGGLVKGEVVESPHPDNSIYKVTVQSIHHDLCAKCMAEAISALDRREKIVKGPGPDQAPATNNEPPS